MTPAPPRVHLLLTATVDPGGVVGMARSDPEIRRRDYQQAIAWWDALASQDVPDSITVCENSGHAIAPSGGGDWLRVAAIAWDGQGFDRRLGKGFGEMQTLKTAFERLAAGWAPTDWVVKCNGRYRVPSAPAFCRHLRQCAGPILVADMTRNLTWCDSRFFGATVDCWQRHILSRLSEIDESADRCFEQVLARAAHALMAQGERFALLPRIPVIQGVSGSMGHNYRTPRAFVRASLKRLLYPLKRAAFRM